MGTVQSGLSTIMNRSSYSVQTKSKIRFIKNAFFGNHSLKLLNVVSMSIPSSNMLFDFRLREIMEQLDSGKSLSATDMRQELGRTVAMLDKVNASSPVREFR